MSQWDGIDEFLAVATANSFTRAAKAIGMSPTHVSRSVLALEQRVQAQLFHRTTRTVALTAAGRLFFERCEWIARERDEAIALIGEQGEPEGDLRLTCSTALGERFVAPIIRRFAMAHRKLGVTIDLSNRVVDLPAEGYDIAIRTGPVDDPRLSATQVASRTLHTCAAPAYLDQMGRPATIADLAGHDCIRGSSPTWHFRQGADEAVHRPKGRFSCNNGQAVMEACVAGFGICQLPDFYVLPYLKEGAVELLLEHCAPGPEPIWAVHPRRRYLSPKIGRTIDCLERELPLALRQAV